MNEQPGDIGVPSERLGFRVGDRGTHTSRTIMLSELLGLLTDVPGPVSVLRYYSAIVDDNILGKKTASTRKLTAQRMSELYALDPSIPVFRVLRDLWELDEPARPLLACLCANARDPILRVTSAAVLGAQVGEIVDKHAIADVVAAEAGGRFNPNTLDKIARNAASSWTQSGHLRGRVHKVRARAVATPAATAYALLLGYMAGARGEGLFQTYWTKLLDAPPSEVDSLAFEASRWGWLDYRRVGDVAAIAFPGLLTEADMEIIRGED